MAPETFTCLPDSLFRRPDVTLADVLTLRAITALADPDSRTVRLSNERLAFFAGIPPASLRRPLKRLDDWGYIVRSNEVDRESGFAQRNIRLVNPPRGGGEP